MRELAAGVGAVLAPRLGCIGLTVTGRDGPRAQGRPAPLTVGARAGWLRAGTGRGRPPPAGAGRGSVPRCSEGCHGSFTSAAFRRPAGDRLRPVDRAGAGGCQRGHSDRRGTEPQSGQTAHADPATVHSEQIWNRTQPGRTARRPAGNGAFGTIWNRTQPGRTARRRPDLAAFGTTWNRTPAAPDGQTPSRQRCIRNDMEPNPGRCRASGSLGGSPPSRARAAGPTLDGP
jgi:hypothetical protein